MSPGAERAAPSAVVVVLLPVGDDDAGLDQDQKMLLFRHSSRIRELNDST
jgi:hypothetical protein